MKVARFVCSLLLFAVATAAAQNPVPFVNQPVLPDAVAPGGPSFTLTVNGSQFVSSSVINWNGAPLNTTFVSNTQLTANVPASNIATAGTAAITVSSPGPGGGTSAPIYLSVADPETSLTFTNYAQSSYFEGILVNPNLSGEISADFNNDGKLDLAFIAFANPQQSTVEACIELGNGDGSFRLPSCVPISALEGGTFVAADFNGDGNLDLAMATGPSDVSILLGNGDGTLQAPQRFPAGPYEPGQLVVGDFNEDGKLDIAVSAGLFSNSGEFSILLGNGDGTFQNPVEYDTPFPPVLAVGDFNRDGKLDLQISDSGGFDNGVSDNNVYMALGNGDGTFQALQLVANLNVTAGGPLVADFNGDGNLDLVFTGQNSDDVPFFAVLLGNGDGTFQPPAYYAIPFVSYGGPVAADINADGKLDLAAAFWNENNLTLMSVLLGNGDGTFQSPINLPTPTIPVGSTGAPAGLLVGDFNGDGRVDILLPYYGPNPFLFFMQGAFPAVGFSPTSLAFPQQAINSPSSPETVTLTNIGLATLTITGIAVGGQNAADFAETNKCESSLAPGASCSINATFTPSGFGNRAALLIVSSDGQGEPQAVVSLSGITTPGAAISLSPANVSFPSQYVGTSSLPKTVTVTNTGTAALTISNVTVSTTDFGTLSNCTNSIPPNTNCTIGVFFDPTASGTRSGTLIVTGNASDSPQGVTLSGAGQDFSMASSGSASATVSPGETATYQLAVAPAGGFKETVSFTCTGAPAGFTCSVPGQITLNGSSTTIVTVTVSGGGSAHFARPGFTPVGNRLAIWLALGGLAGLVILAGAKAGRRSRQIVCGMAFLCLLSVTTTWTACGGGSGGAGGGGTVGSYSVTVTGSFTSGGTTLTHDTVLTLVVQ